MTAIEILKKRLDKMDKQGIKNTHLGAFATVDDKYLQHGLSKREYYAGKAMEAMIANPNIKRPSSSNDLEKELKEFSSIAVEYADALLCALTNEA